jgi:signal transduction histidine kinase/ligand-binding sensor domain-containing protein
MTRERCEFGRHLSGGCMSDSWNAAGDFSRALEIARTANRSLSVPFHELVGDKPGYLLRLMVKTIVSCYILSLCVAALSQELNPNRSIRQYAHAAWRETDGYFGGSVNAIAQTTDGYLWVGTNAGLYRFDGVRFVPWGPSQGAKLNSSAVFSLFGASDGALWVGMRATLLKINGSQFAEISSGGGRVNSIIGDPDGQTWIARSRASNADGGICKIQNDRPRCYGLEDGFPSVHAEALMRDSQGDFWAASSSVLIRWKPGSSATYSPSTLKSSEGLGAIYAIAPESDGSIWVGIGRKGAGLGLTRLNRGRWLTVGAPHFDGAGLEVSALFRDRTGTLWIGTANHGIYRLRTGIVDHFDESDGLSSNGIRSIFQDREGNIWIGTSNGLDSFRDLKVISYSMKDGLGADYAGSVLAARDGTIWVGNHDSLDSFSGGQWHSLTFEHGLPGHRVTALLQDRRGILWVGVDGKFFSMESGKFQEVKRKDGSASGIIQEASEDSDGTIWARLAGASRGELLSIHGHTATEAPVLPPGQQAFSIAADPRKGIWIGLSSGDLARLRNGKLESHGRVFGIDGPIDSIQFDSDGSLWGTSSSGVVEGRDGEFRALTSRDGLPCDNVISLVTDKSGGIWLYSTCGLIAISHAELERWWNHLTTQITYALFDCRDGVMPFPASFHPRATRGTDGKLWFVNESVVQMIDPLEVADNVLPPPVKIEGLIASHQFYNPDIRLRLPAPSRDIEIDYTALSFASPQKVRFRYWLEGRDREWQDPTERRQVFYSNISPGRYRFRVIACNNDGVWNHEGAAIEFVIAAAWYQTRWFRFVCVAICLLIVWSLYCVRVQWLTRSLRARFDERLAERTRVARELHDIFLQSVQASKMIADDALRKGSDPAEMRPILERVSSWLGQAAEEGRAALNSLRVTIEQRNDLAEALQQAVKECEQSGSMEVSFTVTGDVKEMHPAARYEIYRIGHEAIRNACVHSGGTRLEVELVYLKDLILSIRDNGVGIDAAIAGKGKPGHFGLKGMQERATRIGAKLTILSSAETGTTITVVVPGRAIFRKAA